MPSNAASVAGVGIDLVDLLKIQKFLYAHYTTRARRLLAPSERKRFKSRRIPSQTFAKLFTAKEAFFKSLGESWMGLEGFASMEVRFLPGDRFMIRVAGGPLAKKGPRQAEGCFFSFGKYVGAQVIRSSLSFPHVATDPPATQWRALGGNPQKSKTGSPTETFGDDNP